MDPIDESKSFLKHVFNFEKESKSEIFNLLQYAMLAIVPIIALNRTIQKYIPAVDESKSTLELLVEIVGQVSIMFLGLLIVHRIVTYIPTYSDEPYPTYNLIFSVLSVLLVTLSLQTKLGEKTKLLTDRILEMWNGPTVDQETQESLIQNGVVVRQPISGGQSQSFTPLPPPQPVYSDGTPLSALPPSQNTYDTAMQQPPQVQQQDIHPVPVSASEIGSFSGFSSW
jgi:hypothetical protein